MTGVYIGSRTSDSRQREYLDLEYANRHGLIAGATGTGKTVTLQGLAEGFSNAGVPVFMADVKGDLSGLCQPSDMQDFLVQRALDIGFSKEYKKQAFPVVFWDLFGKQGNPLRTTISEIGPLLLARILDLNDTQEGVLNIAFRVADEEGLLLLDLKDLQKLLVFMAENTSELTSDYGNVSKASIGAIQRRLLQLENEGGEKFFGETALELNDFLRTNEDGRGYINLLVADELMQSPGLYATFLLWLLSELFEELPEAGDLDKPKFVFFFDEAHLLFENAPKSLVQKIEQVVRLIRSKAVGIYFITQNPADIPDAILSQLGNRIQHALRSFTAKQRKMIKLAAQTYRENPDFKVEDAITDLGVGEALVSTLEKKGRPSIVQKTLIRPPSSKLGPADADFLRMYRASCPLAAKYSEMIDRRSAYEVLLERSENRRKADEEIQTTSTKNRGAASRSSARQTPVEAFLKSMARQLGSAVGKQLIRGILGALSRK
ncbi:helicase HerA-like domain-containing protein [Neptuniibacter sp. CAU 1671]|uniref:helicase HerA-like domain-containing protein n=1 Tax=Neptuniibacter sp. CAU 1671 TaxID=3032593 RepID=UPI0023DC552F|nr:helicase HerA-like domain-containing protein [Neptuniibacter sp. CAU 1671]MDF2182263.1 DUF853 family protein [Neptuniibacter sp. CAU 1671]